MTGPALSWKLQAVRALGEPSAPRVFDQAQLRAWMASHGEVPPQRTLLRALGEWEAAGFIHRVARGLYLNRQARPIVLLDEAAAFLREGAVVSLATVLGRAGVLNNPTHWVTAIVPSTAKGPAEIEADSGSFFRFGHVRPDLLPAPGTPEAADAYVPYAKARTATPEKALLDWLYLTSTPRGAVRWPLPPAHDWDLGDLDRGRLERLAQAMGLEPLLAEFEAGLTGHQPRVSMRSTRAKPR